MPAGLSRVAAHAFGNDAKPGCLPRLGRKLQPPPCDEAQRLADFGHDERHRARAQRLFHHRQDLGLILARGQKHLVGVAIGGIPLRVDVLPLPAFANPQHGPARNSGGNECEEQGPRTTDFVGTADAKREMRQAGNSHEAVYIAHDVRDEPFFHARDTKAVRAKEWTRFGTTLTR